MTKAFFSLFASFTIVGVLLACDNANNPFAGETYVVGCGNAAAAEVGDQIFDLRPHNSCGRGLISYTRTVISTTEEAEAELRIECGVGLCIGSVQVLAWSDQ